MKQNYMNLISKYEKAGCNELQLRTTDDVKKILKIDVEAIRGFDTLRIAQGMFKKFIVNFLNGFGIQERSQIKPISVCIVRENGGAYVRFDYMKGKYRNWLHVKGANKFY